MDMRDLSAAGPMLHSSARAAFGASASRCLRQNRRHGPITLRLEHGGTTSSLSVQTHNITSALLATYNDLQDATEHGAYGIALLSAARALGATVAERSFKGTGFDFHLHPPGAGATSDPDDIFADKWALEVSGILKGDASKVTERLREKRAQVADAAQLTTTLVAVVEFSEPYAILELQ